MRTPHTHAWWNETLLVNIEHKPHISYLSKSRSVLQEEPFCLQVVKSLHFFVRNSFFFKLNFRFSFIVCSGLEFGLVWSYRPGLKYFANCQSTLLSRTSLIIGCTGCSTSNGPTRRSITSTTSTPLPLGFQHHMPTGQRS